MHAAWLTGVRSAKVRDKTVGHPRGGRMRLALRLVPISAEWRRKGIAFNRCVNFGHYNFVGQWQGLRINLRTADHPHCGHSGL